MTPFPTFGKITRLYVLDFGLLRVHSGPRDIGVPGFLLQTEDGKNILFDTGFPPGYAVDTEGCAERDGLSATCEVLRLEPRNLLAGQLALIGLTPADIDLTILSHSHIDHVGGLAEVTHAPIVMTRTERSNPRPLYHGDARPMEWPEADYRLIDEDVEICEGLILIETPGHTLGHLSALLILPETGPVILTGDAISRFDEVMNGFENAADDALANASADRLLDLAKESLGMVIYGHSPGQWQQITLAPKFYG
ncbi:N-acyl homoserine lactonase family protein [Frigidibacter sp. ROC022]|uniref:N-acyl homoserine lactonase family protein n=1 Tax=Frigidibacter sp. ROC022 TaxID=2971796 RepID=UPI00215A1F87|nr:N-acyl homoserine lactonase family protein [Frigidibacter sp. ROC022]MCR8722948.1 N-acyl homoserine lactonase family protein [Frigidibacter sp. ROC022]